MGPWNLNNFLLIGKGNEAPDDIRQLAGLIMVLLSVDPAGFRALLGGRRSCPGEGDWSDLISRWNPDFWGKEAPSLPSDGVAAVSLINRGGGWENVTRSACYIRENNPRYWNMLVEYIRAKTDPLQSRISGGHLRQVAAFFGVDRKTVRRAARITPVLIAKKAMNG